MADQYEMVKAIYYDDQGNGWIVGLRIDQAAAGWFTLVDNMNQVTKPQLLKMRHVWGVDTGTGSKQKVWVSDVTVPPWTTDTTFLYVGNTFEIFAKVTERRRNKF